MEHGKVKGSSLIVAALLLGANSLMAQKSFDTLPLRLEMSAVVSTPHKGITPVGATLDLNYTFGRKLSVHAIAEGAMFVPKSKMTFDYNRTCNLGGGIGYTFWPENGDHLGDFEVRASVTASVGHADFGYIGYNVGFNWYGHAEGHKVVPMVSVGYSCKYFTSGFLPDYHGMYATLGVRF